jgi:hypothetical protein
MYARRSFLLGLLLAIPMLADKKVTSPTTTGANDVIDLEATIVLQPEEVVQNIGADPGKGIVLLKVKVTPKTDKPVQIAPDDFILLAHDDGERSKPFEPAQLAGQGAMVIANQADAKGKKKGGLSPTIGFGGMMGGGGGSPGNSKPVNLSSKMDDKAKGNNTLLEALKAKQLPTTESTNPVEGYLYFPLDGKHKLKNLAVLYRGPAGRLDLEFQH